MIDEHSKLCIAVGAQCARARKRVEWQEQQVRAAQARLETLRQEEKCALALFEKLGGNPTE